MSDAPSIQRTLTGAVSRDVAVTDAPIALRWLTRLRWLAVIGQLAAVGVSDGFLNVNVPIVPVGLIILVTFVTNVLIVWRMGTGAPPAWVVPGVLLLDVVLLTALLYFAGGATNPFALLYVVHVVMAVVAVETLSAWVIVVSACAAYGVLTVGHHPLSENPLPYKVLALGQWLALVLVSALIAFFVGRVTRELRARQRELAEMRERAAKTEQLASLTTLAAGAAHELGTPLGTIAVVAKEMERAAERIAEQVALLTGESEAAASLAEDARLIRMEVDRCRRILDRMRVDILEDLNRKAEPMEVRAVIDLLRDDLSDAEKARLEVARGPDVHQITTPVRAIRQAVGVLLHNAFDASEESGKPVKLSIYRERGRIIFAVEDQGVGMPGDVLRRVGEPFYTTKPPGRGMGLGLFLVRLVAERLGGELIMTSEPGIGTRSVLEVPEQAGGKS